MTRVTLTIRDDGRTIIYKDVAELTNDGVDLCIRYWNNETNIAKDVYMRCDIFRYTVEEVPDPDDADAKEEDAVEKETEDVSDAGLHNGC